MSREISLARAGIQPAGASLGDDAAPAVDARFLVGWALRSDQRFNSNAEGAYASKRVAAALENAKRVLPLEQPDWELVRDALVNPMPCPGAQPYPVRPVHLILPFIEDVRSAPEAVEKAAKGKRR